MNYALIFAGGRGERMSTRSVPKQFLELHGKPIIIYTIEHFEDHPDIDGIVVVILDGWQEYLERMLRKHAISKVKAVVAGGSTGQESIYNGLAALAEFADDDSIVLIHDGVRPLITRELISKNIEKARESGNAITANPATETVFLETEDHVFGQVVDRTQCRLARAPQSFKFGDIMGAHQKAIAEGRNDFIDSATLMKHYGATLHLVEGIPENIKITNAQDFFIFRAINDAIENQQLFGIS